MEIETNTISLQNYTHLFRNTYGNSNICMLMNEWHYQKETSFFSLVFSRISSLDKYLYFLFLFSSTQASVKSLYSLIKFSSLVTIFFSCDKTENGIVRIGLFDLLGLYSFY